MLSIKSKDLLLTIFLAANVAQLKRPYYFSSHLTTQGICPNKRRMESRFSHRVEIRTHTSSIISTPGMRMDTNSYAAGKQAR